jgi:hypothetical protein
VGSGGHFFFFFFFFLLFLLQPNFCENVPQGFGGCGVVRGDVFVLHGTGNVFFSADLGKTRSSSVALPEKKE